MLKISNFKAVDQLHNETGNVNFVVGNNQSGCTTTLQALMLLCLGANPLVVQSVGLPFYHDVNFLTSFKLPNLFHKNNFKKPIIIALGNQKLCIKSLTPHSYEANLNENRIVYDLKMPYKDKEITHIPLGSVFGIEQNPAELSYDLNYLFQTDNNEVDEEFLAMLNNVINLHHFTDNGKTLHCLQMGLSATRVVQIAIEILRAKNGVLLIDDIDIGLDSTTLGKLLELLFFASKKYNIQIFATSHRPTLITSEIDCSKYEFNVINL